MKGNQAIVAQNTFIWAFILRIIGFVQDFFSKILSNSSKSSAAQTKTKTSVPVQDHADLKEQSNLSESATIPKKVVSSMPKTDPFSQAALCPGNSFIRVHKRLYLALFEEEQASVMAQQELKQNFLIVPRTPESAEAASNPTSLITIHRYDQIARTAARQNPGRKLVFCAGAEPTLQAKAAFLLGCHLIMGQELSADRTYLAFQRFHDAFDTVSLAAPDSTGLSRGVGTGALSVPNCWTALATAKALGWIDFGRVFARGAEVPPSFLSIEDYVYYARCTPAVQSSLGRPRLPTYGPSDRSR
jgi:hypothetical protein